MNIALRPLSAVDAMVLKNVRLRALQESPTAFGSTYAKESQLTDPDWEKRAREWNSGRSACFIAMDADVACGIAAAFPDHDDATRVWLASMWVAPKHRRRDIGRQLVEAILERAGAAGYRTMLLNVTSNNEAAMNFYQRLGFSMTGRIDPYPNDPALRELEMSLPVQR